ncbi:hypothetical protein DBR06_SOUSAS20910022, partial [Sousa chinensis]
RTFVFSTLVEFFQGERHFSSSKHPYGYWNQYEVGIIVTYGNLGIFRDTQAFQSTRLNVQTQFKLTIETQNQIKQQFIYQSFFSFVACYKVIRYL